MFNLEIFNFSRFISRIYFLWKITNDINLILKVFVAYILRNYYTLSRWIFINLNNKNINFIFDILILKFSISTLFFILIYYKYYFIIKYYRHIYKSRVQKMLHFGINKWIYRVIWNETEQWTIAKDWLIARSIIFSISTSRQHDLCECIVNVVKR